MDDEKQVGNGEGSRGSKEVLSVFRRHWVALDKGLLFLLLGLVVLGVGIKFGALL